MRAVAGLVTAGWPVRGACQVIGVPRSTYYHRRRPGPATAGSRSRKDTVQPHALTGPEVDGVLAVLTDPDLADKSVCQAYWEAMDTGRVRCSQSTFYRIARAHALVGDRRPCRTGGTGPGRPKPVVAATAPNQLWSWDISELPGPGRVRYHLFLVMDVYSRYPLGWRIEQRALKEHAAAMFTDTFARYGLPVVVHSDNGTQMRSHQMADLLAGQVTTSFSRPHVSDDNPFSEALFKTIKYDPGMPAQFASIQAARDWMGTYLDRYAHQHHHAGLGRYTPAQVFTGTAATVRAARQAHLDAAYKAHPARYAKPPLAPPLPGPTGINVSKAA